MTRRIRSSRRSRDVAPRARVEPLREFWHYFRENRGAVIGLVVLVAADAGGALRAAARAAPARRSSSATRSCRPPAWQAGGSLALPARHRRGRPRHPLAPDLRRALLAVRSASSSSRSALVGRHRRWACVAGYCPRLGRDADHAASWTSSWRFPSLLLALVLVAILGPGPVQRHDRDRDRLHAAFRPADPRRGASPSCAKDYVTGARVAGAGPLRLMFLTILPNCLAPLIVQATLRLLQRHPRRGGARLPRHGRAAADARMGHDAGRGARVHPARLVGGDLPRPRHPGHRAGHQPDGRRAARRARPQAEGR